MNPGTEQRSLSRRAFAAAIAAAAGAGPILRDRLVMRARDAAVGAVPMFRGDPARTGVNPGPGPAGEPVELWRFPTGAMGLSSPAVVDGVVFVGDAHQEAGPGERQRGFVRALDAATGALVWRADARGPVVSSPAVVDGTVYVGTRPGPELPGVLAVDAATGRERWRFSADGGIVGSPLVVDGMVFIGSSATCFPGGCGAFYALDARSGDLRWRLDVGDPDSLVETFDSSPAFADGTLYVGNDDGSLYAIDAASGALRWQAPLGQSVHPTPALVAGRVYVASRNGGLHALDAATGQEIWTLPTGGEFASSAAVAGGLVYVAADDGHVFAVDAGTGTERWRSAIDGAGFSSPVIADGVLYVGSAVTATDTDSLADASGFLHAVDATTGVERWRFPTGGVFASPAVVGGVVYVPALDGTVYAIGGSEAA